MTLDLATFAAVIETVGIGQEQNPVMAQGYSLGGIVIVAALKLAALAAIVLLVARVRRPRLRVIAAGIAIVVGVTGAASNVTAWAASTPRPAQQAVFSPASGRTGQPDSDHPGAQPAGPVPGRITPSTSSVTGSGPETAGRPAAATSLRGLATWFRSPSGVSAAGPRLRAALPGWRGTSVQVCHADRCTVTVLGDVMRADRLVDLDDDAFRALAPLSVGVIRVVISVIPNPPQTTTDAIQ
jgi:hypothetical protein